MLHRSMLALCGLCTLCPALPLDALAGEKKQQDFLETVKHQPRLVTQLGHSAGVYYVALSNDCKWLVTGGDNTARLWEVATGREVRVFQEDRRLDSMALSGDGKWLVTCASINARLWEVATGKEIRLFKGHSSLIPAVTISGNGKWLITGSFDQTARLWDLTTGKEIRKFLGHSKRVTSVALSEDSKWLVTGSDDKTVRLWDVATGEKVRDYLGHTGNVSSLAVSKDGKWLVTGSYDGVARLWEMASGKEVRIFENEFKFHINSVALTPDGKWLVQNEGAFACLRELATGKGVRAFTASSAIMAAVLSKDGKSMVTGTSDGAARLWDLATGKLIRAFHGYSKGVTSAALTGDAKWLITGTEDKTARVWDLVAGQEILALQMPRELQKLYSVALSEDGKWAVTGSATARLWEVATGKLVRDFTDPSYAVHSLALSRDGKWLVTGNRDGAARLWEVATGKLVRVFPGPMGVYEVQSVVLSANAKSLVTVTDNTVRMWELATGKELSAWRTRAATAALSSDGKRLVAGNDFRELAAGTERHLQEYVGDPKVLSEDGKWLIAGGLGNTIRLWDLDTGKKVRDFVGHSQRVSSLALSKNSKWLVTGSPDNTIRFWELETGKQLCQLVSFRDRNWAVVDSEGRYDASNAGNVQGLHWVADNHAIALNQLKERYYDPGLLAKYLGFRKEPLRNVQAFKDVKLFPTVEAVAPPSGSTTLQLKLANQGGGIGRVQVFVNGRELAADARGPKFDPDVPTTTMTVDLSGAILLPGEKNDIRIVTWNKEGYLSSRGAQMEWEAPGRKDVQPIELHAIVVGVSDYAADSLKLHFSSKDAVDIAKALELGGKRLFGAAKTHVTLLCDHGRAGTLPPTRTNIENAFATARKCRPTDVLVVYMAGHGVALPEKSQEVYCYLTKEARTVNQDAFRDPDVRRQYAVTSTELTEWFKKIPALKQVLILDTCAAGAAANKLIEHRDVGADQIRAIDRLRDRTGFHVLMGCASDKVSYEASQYSQGLLTYSLLQGMRGGKLRDNEYVDVMDLFQYAADQVPQLARNIGGIQKPLILAPRGTSFDIGQLKDNDKKLIPLAIVRPLLLRPVLQNADENVFDDDLKLMGRLRTLLSEENYARDRGARDSAAVYVDAEEMPGAIRPTGKYTVVGKKVQVRLVLRKDGQTVGTLQVEGTSDQLDALAQQLAAAILLKVKTP